jgi:phospholipid transport system substrate-binding protein
MKASIRKARHHVSVLRKFLRVAGVVFFLVIIASIAQGAEAPADPAAQFVQKLGDEALTARKLPDSERTRRVAELVRNNIDVPAIGRFMLGTYWRETTAEQRQRYFGLIEKQLVLTYNRRFGGQFFRVARVVRDSNGDDILVDTQIGQTNGRAPVSVDWRVRDDHGQMKIIDIVVEGMSMSVERRGDFASIIERNGGNVEALLNTLQGN